MTARKRRRLLLFAACFGLGGVIGWKWGAPERQQEYADSLGGRGEQATAAA